LYYLTFTTLLGAGRPTGDVLFLPSIVPLLPKFLLESPQLRSVMSFLMEYIAKDVLKDQGGQYKV
jgi:hypothetical protein